MSLESKAKTTREIAFDFNDLELDRVESYHKWVPLEEAQKLEEKLSIILHRRPTR